MEKQQLLYFLTDEDKKCAEVPTADESSGNYLFKLVDEIGLKQKTTALKTLLSLTQSGKDMHEILGLIAWHIRRLGRTKVFIKQGMVKEQIAQALKVSYYTAEKIINQAKNFSVGEIKRAQQLLIETDARLKKNVYKPQVLLEMLVIRLSSGL